MKKENKKNSSQKNNWTNWFMSLVFLAILMVLLLTYFNNWIKFQDENVKIWAFRENLANYETIEIDWNKIIWTYSWIIEEWNQKRQKRDIAIVPENKTFEDLWIIWSWIEQKTEYADQASKEMFYEVLKTLWFILLVLIIWLLFLGKMWGIANSTMTFWKSRAKLLI